MARWKAYIESKMRNLSNNGAGVTARPQIAHGIDRDKYAEKVAFSMVN